MSKLSDRLETIKKERHLLQKNIAKDVGVALRTYQYYESGERRPDSDMLLRLAEYFDVSVDYLLGRTDNPQINK